MQSVGNHSLRDDPHKLAHAGISLFEIPGAEAPFVEGCAAWMACELLPEIHNQETYDLFIGQIIGAWSDVRVFSNGHWHYEAAGPEWRSLHHVAGGHFYAIGDPLGRDTP